MSNIFFQVGMEKIGGLYLPLGYGPEKKICESMKNWFQLIYPNLPWLQSGPKPGGRSPPLKKNFDIV